MCWDKFFLIDTRWTMENASKIQEYTLQLLEESNVSFNSFEEFRKHIIQRINDWINNDFLRTFSVPAVSH